MKVNNENIGWLFPPTGGGMEGGFKDSGLAHFSGQPLSSLARETIQNSLDARKYVSKPVQVSFELIQISPEDIGGDELIKIINSCIETAKNNGTDNEQIALEKARDMLMQDKISSLIVSDQNTTGLRKDDDDLGNKWRALIKVQGLSQKSGLEGAGGSYGIGKHAPFVVSTLRTVFYWTYYEQKLGDNVDVSPKEFFQGKSILISHENSCGQVTQGTGFYGIKDQCQEIENPNQIPNCFRILDNHRKPICGTKLIIVGFSLVENWRNRIASSIISNYFHAIANKKLEVILEIDETQDDDLFQIDASSLKKWFDYLLNNSDNNFINDEDMAALKRAQCYWSLLEENCHIVEKQDRDLGHCKLWIRVGDRENLPSRVALIRGTGMLVTDQQARLQHFRQFREFAAVCLFEDPKGNELLRGMENPQHNKFEYERLPEGEQREKGRKALRRITDWIRKGIISNSAEAFQGLA